MSEMHLSLCLTKCGLENRIDKRKGLTPNNCWVLRESPDLCASKNLMMDYMGIYNLLEKHRKLKCTFNT